MKKIVKIIGAASAAALAAALVPYRFKSDKESGEFELGGLLWNLKKTPGEEEDTYTMELLPFLNQEVEEKEAELAGQEDASVEEPFAEQAEDELIVEEVKTDAEPVEEPFAEEPTVEITVEVPEDGEDAPDLPPEAAN